MPAVAPSRLSFVNFRGGAAGSAATHRRSAEKNLLQGLKDLLSNLDTPPGSPRGRQNARSFDQKETPRDDSPGWEVKGRGKRVKRGKGKGNGQRPRLGPETSYRESRPRTVTFEQDSDNSLIARLKALILEHETHRSGNLVTKLKRLISEQTSLDVSQNSHMNTPVKGTGKTKASIVSKPAQRPSAAHKTPTPVHAWPKLDPGWWTKAHIGAKQLIDTLDVGKSPNATVACVSMADCTKIRALAEAHDINHKLALVCVDASIDDPDVPDSKIKWCRLAGARWKKFRVMPLRKEFPDWPVEPEFAKVENLPQSVNLDTFRIIFCKEFMTPFEWSTTMKKPTESVLKILPQGTSFRSYGWHHNPHPKEESVIGFIKVAPDDGKLLMGLSGWKAGFFQKIHDKDTAPPKDSIKWLSREDKTSSQYLADAKTQAKQQNCGIVLRRGGRNNLGLFGVSSDLDLGVLRRRWAARNIPLFWGPAEVKDLMTKQGFRTFGDLLPPNHRGGIWTFKGAWKGDGHSECKIIDVGGDKPVVVSQWTAAPKKTLTCPLFASRGWVMQQSDVSSQHPQQSTPIAVNGTNDSPNDEDQKMQPADDDADMNAVGVKRGPAASPEKSKERAKTSKTDSTGSKTPPDDVKDGNGPENLLQWDLGGYGDCGFRCVAAVNSLRNGKSREDIEKHKVQLALSLRARSRVTLEENREQWNDSWFVDPEMTEITEDGEVPQNVDAYLAACKRKGKWYDSWLCWASAQVIETPIVVFKFSQNQWIFLQRFDPDNSSKDRNPIPLFLKGGHFTTLDPSIPIPPHWIDIESKDVAAGVSFLGGGPKSGSSPKSVPGEGPKDVDQLSSCSSWLKPPPVSSPAKSYSSWLKPPSDSASKTGKPAVSRLQNQLQKRSGADKSAATSFRGHNGSVTPSVAPGGAAENPALVGAERWEPPVFKKGRPPTKVKFRLWGKQGDPRKPKKWNPRMPWQWECPIHTCKIVLKGTYAGVMTAKNAHLRMAHPEVPLATFRQERPPEKIETSPDFSDSERAWSCPLCSHGLPDVPTHVRNRAIREHCKRFHPDETPKTLSFKNRIGTVNSGCSSHQSQRRQKERDAIFKTHSIVKVDPVERRIKDPINCRGFLYYCKNCFSQLRGATSHKAEMTCEERQGQMLSNGFVLSRKRAWWNSWIANEPKTAASFLTASGLTKEHMSTVLKLDNESYSSKSWKIKRQKAGFVGCGRQAKKVQKPYLKKPASSATAYRGVRVGEAKNPGPLEVWSVNTQGDSGAWAVLRLKESPDVWLLQETWFNDSGAAAFRRTAHSKGYVAYTQNGVLQGRGVNQRNGGVAVLIKRGLVQRFAAQFNQEDSQGIFVWVQGLFLGSIYSPPYEHCIHGATSGFVDAMVQANVKPSNSWFFGGDFNEVPGDSLMAETVQALNGSLSTLGKPTRFEGRREIDWFCSNCPHMVSQVSSPEVVIGDHLILGVTVDVPTPRPSRGVLPKGPNFNCPDDCSIDDWRERLKQSWIHAKRHFKVSEILRDQTKDVQVKWDTFQGAIRYCFLLALNIQNYANRKARHKGAVASVRTESLLKSGVFAPMRERKLRHKLAQWYEVDRLRSKLFTASLSNSHMDELLNLSYKLTGIREVPSRQLIQQNIRWFHSELRSFEEHIKQNNLSNWKSRMHASNSHVSKWLRSKAWSGPVSVVDQNGNTSETWHEGAEKIHQYWTEFWESLRDSVPDFDLRRDSLLAGIQSPQNPVQIGFPTGVQMMARAQDASGSAGPDAWASSEIKHLPLDVFDTLADLFRMFALVSTVPTQLHQSRMCCLSKPGRVANYAIKASDTRPITICSVWYRIWASTLCKNTDFRHWLKQVLIPEVAGLSHQDIYENLIEIFDNYHRHGYLLALDYTKAFDCINSRLSCEILTAHRWPPLLVTLLGEIWGHQSRFVQWDYHTHHEVLNGSGVQPQGDPLGPLIMTLWVQSGIHSINSRLGIPQNTSSTKVYLDDRTATASTSRHLSALHHGWSEWSRSVGLLENNAKAVVTAVGKARFDKISADFPAHMVQRSVKILGAVSCSGRRRIHEDENRRVLAAKHAARLLGCCGFLLTTHLRYLKQFSLSKVNYGWVARGPTWTLSKSLWSCFWMSARRVRYSSPWLRALFLGGNLHLDITWATRLLAAVLRFRLSKSHGPGWSMSTGTCAHALRCWMKSKNFAEVRPWVWFHSGANVYVDVSCQPSSVTASSLIGLAAHNCRQGWRSWVFQKWLESGRHELNSLPPLNQESFRSISVEDTRTWLLSAAPAATVALGATFSSAHWAVVPNSSLKSSACPRGCGSLGHWSHLCWECPLRPSHAPSRPSCPLLARFGWSSVSTLQVPDVLVSVRAWLLECQGLLWQTKDSGFDH